MKLGTEWQDVADATSMQDISACAKRFAEARGFARYSVAKLHQHPWSECELAAATHNYPTHYTTSVYDSDDGADDPVMQFVKTRHVPLWWTHRTYEAAGKAHMWERAVALDSNMKGGAIVALHLPEGWHVTVGVESEDVASMTLLHAQKVMSDLVMFSAYTAEVLLGPRFRTIAAEPSVRPTPRGVEVLKMVAQGMSNAQISYRLDITERTVAKHLADCAERLGCVRGRRELILAKAIEHAWLD